MGKTPPTSSTIRALAYTHENLIRDPSDDPVVHAHVFKPYESKDFTSTKVQTRVMSVTWYADEKADPEKGIEKKEWQGKFTSSGEIFQTYAYTVALHKDLQETYPAGSFIRIEHNERSVIAQVTDTKGHKGIDLSKAVADAIDFDKKGSVTITLLEKKPENIYILMGAPSDPFKSKPATRTPFLPLLASSFKMAQRIRKMDLETGIARPKAFEVHDRKHRKKNPNGDNLRMQPAMGPFPSMESARTFAQGYCARKENAAVTIQCSTMVYFEQRPIGRASFYNKAPRLVFGEKNGEPRAGAKKKDTTRPRHGRHHNDH